MKKYNRTRENNSRWKGGNSIGYILSQAKKSVLDIGRNLDTCEICFSKKNIVIHHIDKNRKNNDAVNLKVLCSSCHQKSHPEKKRNKNKCQNCGKFISLNYIHICSPKGTLRKHKNKEVKV